MKYLIVFALLIGANTQIYSQGLGYSKAEIIKHFGNNYDPCENTPCITYTTSKQGANGYYQRLHTLFFDEDDVCIMVSYHEPISEINAWVKEFESKGFVRLKELHWKDYAKSIEYRIKSVVLGGVDYVEVLISYSK